MTLEEIGALFGDTVATDVVAGDEKTDDSQSHWSEHKNGNA